MKLNSKNAQSPVSKFFNLDLILFRVSPTKCLSLMTAVAALGVTSAYADLYDVNFYASSFGGSTASGAAVLGSLDDIWNGIDGSANSTGGPIALVNTLNSLSSITLDYASQGAVIPLATDIHPNPSLMTDYLFNNSGGSITLTLNNLAPNTQYNLYLYVSSGDASGGDRAAQVSANAVSAFATGDPQTSFVAGENYVMLTPTSDGSGIINITEAPGAGNSSSEVDMNGLQLQTVPEPTTLGLLILGGLGWLAFRAPTRKSPTA